MRLNLHDIAARIDAHLKRFEADKSGVNRDRGRGPSGLSWESRGRPFYRAGASAAGRYVYVRYVSYQGLSRLKRGEALAYLAWLDAGNVGTYAEQQREAAEVLCAGRHAALHMEAKQAEEFGRTVQLYRVACECGYRGCWLSSAEMAEQSHARHAEQQGGDR